MVLTFVEVPTTSCIFKELYYGRLGDLSDPVFACVIKAFYIGQCVGADFIDPN